MERREKESKPPKTQNLDTVLPSETSVSAGKMSFSKIKAKTAFSVSDSPTSVSNSAQLGFSTLSEMKWIKRGALWTGTYNVGKEFHV